MLNYSPLCLLSASALPKGLLWAFSPNTKPSLAQGVVE